MVLEDNGPVRPRFIHFPSVQYYPAAGCPDQAGDDVEQGGFAAARMTDDGNKFPTRNIQADRLQHIGRVRRKPHRHVGNL